MREIRLSGSEGGGTEFNRFSLPLSKTSLRLGNSKLPETHCTRMNSDAMF